MIRTFNRGLPIFLLVALVIACGKEKTPSRDHIPLIKAQLARLQVGVKNKNVAAIDSVLSIDILKYQQSSDSLLRYAYGADGMFSFESFGQPVIIYTEKVAKVEAVITDSTHQNAKPVIFTFIFEHDQWLLNKFEPDTSKDELP